MRPRRGPSEGARTARWRAWIAPGDIVLIVLLAGVAAALPAWRPGGGRLAERAVVEVGADIERELLLDRNGRYTFTGPLGATTVEVTGGGLRVVSSRCPRKLCMMRGTIRRPGELTACVPNGVVVHLVGGSPAVDGITGP